MFGMFEESPGGQCSWGSVRAGGAQMSERQHGAENAGPWRPL